MEPDQHFSKEHIEKKVNSEILASSLTLFPAAGGFLALLGGALFASVPALVVGGLGIGLSAGYYSLQKLKNFSNLSQKYVDTLRQEQKLQLIQKLDSLGPELTRLSSHQGAEQVGRLKEKFEGLCSVIKEKIGNDQVKAARLNAIAEQLYLATIDNLVHAKQILSSIDNINLDYIDKQIQRAHSDEERESLEERRQLKLEGINAAEECIAHNEVAMTKINQLSMQLAKAKQSSFDMESSLHEITNNVRIEQWETQ